MIQCISKYFVAGIAVLASGVALGQTQVPNQFQAGQPARAAEVNDNFSTLEAAINTNASDIQALNAAQDMVGPHVALMDATQTEVGFVQNWIPASQTQPFQHNYVLVWIEVGADYVPLFAYENFIGNSVNTLVYYDGAGCTGTPYIRLTDYNFYNPGVLGVYNNFLLSDGLTVAQPDTSTTVSASYVSYEAVVTAAIAITRECTTSTGTVNAYPIVTIGTLPLTTPPYSTKLVMN